MVGRKERSASPSLLSFPPQVKLASTLALCCHGMAEAATPALPLELIELIISHSLPPLAFATFPARYDLLFTFSTVSKSWHEIAIRALYKELWIADDVAEQLLWERVGARGEGGTKRVKRLWCGRVPTDADNEVYSSHFVDRALSYSPNVKRVQLVALGLTSLDFAAFDRELSTHHSYPRADRIQLQTLKSWTSPVPSCTARRRCMSALGRRNPFLPSLVFGWTIPTSTEGRLAPGPISSTGRPSPTSATCP